MKLSIIIVTYHSEKHIFECVESILKYNDIGNELEIIIVDNNSSNVDKTFDKLKKRFPNQIILIKSPINGGYGYGNNIGIKASSASIVVVMNPDVRIEEPIFKKIISMFQTKTNIGLAGVSFIDKSNSLYFKPEYQNLFRMLLGKYLLKLGMYKDYQIFFSGSFLVFDKVSFIKAGCFDENIFMYYEEADISSRMLSIGKKIYLSNDILVRHLVHGRRVNHYLLKVGAESRAYYFDKYDKNLDKYYKNLSAYYKIKYFAAKLTKNNLKKEEFAAWIDMCKKKGNLN